MSYNAKEAILLDRLCLSYVIVRLFLSLLCFYLLCHVIHDRSSDED